jgi:hypothetical protein
VSGHGATLALAVLALPLAAGAAAGATAPSLAVGPAPVHATVASGPLRLDLRVAPNRGAVANGFAVRLRSGAAAVHGARLSLTITMLDMPMPPVALRLRETRGGTYLATAAPFLMLGRYRLAYRVQTASGRRASVELVDRISS